VTRWVLVTRAPADCVELQERFTGTDLRVRPYPVLRIEDVSDDHGWQRAADIARSPGAWLVLASPRAPERLRRLAEARGMEHVLELPVAAVGSGTAQAAEAAGFTPTVVGPGTGAGLATILADRMDDGAPAIFACGHDRRPEMPRALESAGHQVHPLVVYRMRETPSRELPPLGPSLEAVVLTSPRSATLYLAGVGGRPLPCTHWALGPTTRDAAAALGIECRIPARPDLESLAEELCHT
jgi:uroporphyrinogen-III synthase